MLMAHDTATATKTQTSGHSGDFELSLIK